MLRAPAIPAARAVEVPLIDLQAQFRTVQTTVEDALGRLLESQRFVLGEPVEELERKIAELVGSAHAVGCASGTDALLLPLRLLGENRGGEVIVPAFTFFATAGAVHNAGLKPVFCDVDESTFNVTGASIDAVWSDRTVGVIPVHLFGQMAPMDEILDLADRGADLGGDVRVPELAAAEHQTVAAGCCRNVTGGRPRHSVDAIREHVVPVQES